MDPALALMSCLWFCLSSLSSKQTFIDMIAVLKLCNGLRSLGRLCTNYLDFSSLPDQIPLPSLSVFFLSSVWTCWLPWFVPKAPYSFSPLLLLCPPAGGVVPSHILHLWFRSQLTYLFIRGWALPVSGLQTRLSKPVHIPVLPPL